MANQLTILVAQQTSFTSVVALQDLVLDMLDYGPIETTKTHPKLPESYNSNAPVRNNAGRSPSKRIEDGEKNQRIKGLYPINPCKFQSHPQNNILSRILFLG